MTSRIVQPTLLAGLVTQLAWFGCDTTAVGVLLVAIVALVLAPVFKRVRRALAYYGEALTVGHRVLKLRRGRL